MQSRIIKEKRKGNMLRSYQEEGVKCLINHKRFLLADEPGLGKTIQAINAVNALNVSSVLVCCPKSMIITWEREIAKWGNGSARYTVTNYEQLITKKGLSLYQKKYDVVIADESHLCLKRDINKRCKALINIIDKADRAWLLTATPASVSAEDYFVTLKVLLPMVYAKYTKKAFLERYCNKVFNPFTYSRISYTGFKNGEELQKAFSKCALKRRKAEVATDLPSITYIDRYACVDASQLMNLDPSDFQRIKESVLNGVEIGTHYQGVLRHNALLKIPSLIEILSTYHDSEPVVVFAWHTEVIDKIVAEVKVLGKSVGVIKGGDKNRQEVIDKFQEGKLSVLVCNIQSGGVGITLTKSSNAIYVQFPSSVSHWVQSLNRIHRIGSSNPVNIIKLMIPDSIDADIFSILESRSKHINEIGV